MQTEVALARRLLPWRTEQGRTFVTVVAKAGYSLADARQAAPSPIGPLDLVPYKSFADVVVKGRIRRAPAPRLVGFAIARGVDVLLQKTALVRTGAPMDAPHESPFGGSVGPTWARIDARLPATIRGDLDVRCYQLAPSDQWLPHFLGGEQVRLLGFEQVADDLTLRLPRLSPRAILRAAGGRQLHVPFLCDTLSVDPDADLVSATYRGAVEWPLGAGSSDIEAASLEVALHPIDDDGKSLGTPTAWIRARHAARKPVSPVVERFELQNPSGFAALARPWTFRPGETRRVFFVKATFAVSDDGRSLTPASEQPPLEGDRLAEDGTLERASDLAPVKQDVDLVVRGTARASAGDSTTAVQVSFGALQTSFETLAGSPVRLGPVAPTDPARMALLGTFDDAWRNERWPFLPADCDPRAFQFALPSLRVPAARENERLRVTGLLDGGRIIDVRLPAARPRAFALASPDAEVAEVELKLDTVVLDGEAMRLDLVWRGSLPMEVASGATERALVLRHVEGDSTKTEAVDRAIAVLRAPHWAEATALETASAGPRSLDEALLRWTRLAKKLSEAAAVRLPPAPRPPARAEVLRDVAAQKSFTGRDLTRADLAGADLRKANLRGAILRGAKLDDAQLEGADLSGAILASASLLRASLDGAKLARADLRAARAAGASFREAGLDGAVLSRADLRGASLAGARGKGVLFVEADLTDASLEAAAVPKADLTKATLERALLAGADLSDAKLYEARAKAAKLDRANLTDARFELAELRDASFQEAQAAGSTWDGAELTHADFQRAELTGAIFSAARLNGARLTGIRAERASFRAADLSGSDLRSAHLRAASFQDARLDDARLEEANLHTAELAGASVRGAHLGGALLSGTKLERASR
ncbi:MAG: DUF2169 domain-containing protein [Polyangiaceae bacterium]|nr:DUF2169 domain-containing protein [Polyangiaceae bacterium]